MTISRRTVLKSTVLGPAFSLVNSVFEYPQGTSSSTFNDMCWVNILLHGLFFMEFKPQSNADTLVITAPDIKEHKHCMLHNGLFMEFPLEKPFQMDLRTQLTDLVPGKIDSFEHYPAIPQFSKTQAKVGELVGQNYRLRIVLPLPQEIVPLRCGSLMDFGGAAEGQVKESIMSECGKGGNNQFALVTCLRYLKSHANASPPGSTHSFYAEHMQVPDPQQTNQAYKTAGQLFSHPENFDLRLRVTPPPSLPRVPRDFHPGFGVSSDDEISLPERWEKPSNALVDVGSCIQLGLH